MLYRRTVGDSQCVCGRQIASTADCGINKSQAVKRQLPRARTLFHQQPLRRLWITLSLHFRWDKHNANYVPNVLLLCLLLFVIALIMSSAIWHFVVKPWIKRFTYIHSPSGGGLRILSGNTPFQLMVAIRGESGSRLRKRTSL